MAFLLSDIKDKYVNFRGFHTDRKLVVIESDDWGSIRMPSSVVYRYLQQIGDAPEKDAFLRNDSLEGPEDLEMLYEVLYAIRDSHGAHPIITANFAMANPDFDHIDYTTGLYAYEPFFCTYDRYYGSSRALTLVRQGYDQKLMLPQLH